MKRPVAYLAVLIFFMMSLLHLCRLACQWNVNFGGHVVPMWASIPGALIPAVMAVLLWRESRR